MTTTFEDVCVIISLFAALVHSWPDGIFTAANDTGDPGEVSNPASFGIGRATGFCDQRLLAVCLLIAGLIAV